MTTRRDFLKHGSAALAAASVPYYFTSQPARAQDGGPELTVASIGVGGSRGRYNRGGAIARNAAKFAKMIAVCDVDDLHSAEFASDFDNHPKTYRDYRKMFDEVQPDIVTIGTPDHWHVPIAIHALRAGCDVYCEKPLTLTIDEGKKICEVVRETGRVFQVGTQQRSSYNNQFLMAVAMVRSGRLGDHVNAHVAIGGAPAGGPFQPTPAPPDIDWDLWLGPAQKAPYMEERRMYFRWFYDYSGGKMTDWGAHHIDIAQWALGVDETGPVEIGGTGTFPPLIPEGYDPVAYFAGRVKLPHAYNTAMTFDVDLKFANGSVISVNDLYQSEDGQTEFPNGILFEGDKGRIFVNRGKLTGKPVEELTDADKEELQAIIGDLCKGKKPGNHMQNFIECVGDRSEPISDVFTHHRTMTSCHMCNITLLLGRTLKWDPEAQVFLGDDQANALMTRPRRAPYDKLDV